jgi:hypothetical protein
MPHRFDVLLPVLLFVSFAFNGCGSEDENRGAIATLSWTPVAHDTPVSYSIHYGKQSSGQNGACNYENVLDVSEPPAVVEGLEFDTTYYFAVSASDGSRSACSNEVSKHT